MPRNRNSLRLLAAKNKEARRLIAESKEKTHDKFAKKVGIHRDTLSKFLASERIDREIFEEICKHLEKPWEELADLEEFELRWSGSGEPRPLSAQLPEQSYQPLQLGLKIFLSFPKEYQSIAYSFQQTLVESHYKIFSDSGISIGKSINLHLREKIEQSDYLLICLSDGDSTSPRIAQKIQFALDNQQKKQDLRPIVVGVTVKGSRSLTQEFKLTNNEAFNFADLRSVEISQYPTPTEILSIMQEISLKISFINDPDNNQELFESSIQCYEELFPDENDRIDPNDIVTWIKESSGFTSRKPVFKRLYPVLHLGEYAIGMAYITCPIDDAWCFGSYLGVKRAWRRGNRTRIFIDAIEFELKKLNPKLKGMVFEVHPVDFELLHLVAERGRISGEVDQNLVIKNLIALRRLILFQSFGARMIVQEDHSPFPYIQPALGDNLTQDEEQHLLLFAYGFTNDLEATENPEEVLDFIYERFFKVSRNKHSNVYIPRFDEYIDILRERINATKVGNLKFDRLPISTGTMSRLRKICQQEKLSSYLEL
jgi:DNA-binding Xre family transcriptional regulator